MPKKLTFKMRFDWKLKENHTILYYLGILDPEDDEADEDELV